MKKLLALLACVAALTCAAAELPTDIKLTNGFVMKDCTIVRWAKDVITVKYVGGTVLVRLENIEPGQRGQIESHQEEALKQQLIADQKETKALITVAHKQEVHDRRDAKRQAEIDRKINAIALGVEQHHLVAGMTMDQVRAMFGTPFRSSSLTSVNTSEWWIYAGLGRDANGVPTNLQVHFKAGFVTHWNNTQH